MGCFWTWQNGVFRFVFFWGFSIKKVCFWCVWHCFKSVNACFFPQFSGAFLGWLIIVHLGLEGLAVFVFLVFVFLCCVVFVSVLLVVLLVLWLFCCLFFLFFVFFFVFFVLFFGGFKGQVRWPKRPPHLALNPPYFLVFVFVCCFFVWLFGFCFLFLFFWRVRWGGPKGHLTWP